MSPRSRLSYDFDDRFSGDSKRECSLSLHDSAVSLSEERINPRKPFIPFKESWHRLGFETDLGTRITSVTMQTRLRTWKAPLSETMQRTSHRIKSDFRVLSSLCSVLLFVRLEEGLFERKIQESRSLLQRVLRSGIHFGDEFGHRERIHQSVKMVRERFTVVGYASSVFRRTKSSQNVLKSRTTNIALKVRLSRRTRSKVHAHLTNGTPLRKFQVSLVYRDPEVFILPSDFQNIELVFHLLLDLVTFDFLFVSMNRPSDLHRESHIILYVYRDLVKKKKKKKRTGS